MYNTVPFSVFDWYHTKVCFKIIFERFDFIVTGHLSKSGLSLRHEYIFGDLKFS
jgi:hypothetical protein